MTPNGEDLFVNDKSGLEILPSVEQMVQEFNITDGVGKYHEFSSLQARQGHDYFGQFYDGVVSRLKISNSAWGLVGYFRLD